MSISSSLESFSLPELFRLIERGSKSGRLILQIPQESKSERDKLIYYIWFQKGYLIAVTNCLNYRGLIDLISDRGWLSPPVSQRLRTLCPPQVPLGVYLRDMKLLSHEQLSLVFQLQLHQVYQLFNFDRGRFRFDELDELQDRILTLPWLEMTGYKIRTTEVTLYALRLVENWDVFAERLPEAGFALKRLVSQPHLKLLTIERQIWELADGSTSLASIARKTLQPLKEIQIAAFRIIVVGLVDEIFLANYGWQSIQEERSNFIDINPEIPAKAVDDKKTIEAFSESRKRVSLGLIGNLIKFLKGKFLGSRTT